VYETKLVALWSRFKPNGAGGNITSLSVSYPIVLVGFDNIVFTLHRIQTNSRMVAAFAKYVIVRCHVQRTEILVFGERYSYYAAATAKCRPFVRGILGRIKVNDTV
jgi:hypothetical protein